MLLTICRVPADINEARRLAIAEADQARQGGINMFAIGIGPEITQDVLNNIADRPASQHTFKVNYI